MSMSETLVKDPWPHWQPMVAKGNFTTSLGVVEWRAYSAPILPGFGYGLNGYVKFSQSPIKDEGYRSLEEYVIVHGGITYYKRGFDGSCVYGFDTLHYGSDRFPRDDVDWIREQCIGMAYGLARAAQCELAGLSDSDAEAYIGDEHE